MKATRIAEIDGRKIAVFDNLLQPAEIAQLSDALDSNAFTRSEVARPDTQQFRHWAINLTLETARKLPIFGPAQAAADGFTEGTRYRLYRSYCNYAAYGDMLFTHTDCLPDAHELTALWFIARQWDVEWGGETLFFNGEMDAECVVTPRPGRLVIFDGAITHVGRPPNRICHQPRYTFALKFERIAG